MWNMQRDGGLLRGSLTPWRPYSCPVLCPWIKTSLQVSTPALWNSAYGDEGPQDFRQYSIRSEYVTFECIICGRVPRWTKCGNGLRYPTPCRRWSEFDSKVHQTIGGQTADDKVEQRNQDYFRNVC